jgi:glycosyltransferase involved in cell wall biosynthesis
VENGLDEDFLRSLPPPEKAAGALGLSPSLVSEGRIFFSFIGRLTREKGIDLFLQAAEGILGAEARAVALVAGSGPEEGRVREAERRWRGRLFYVGFQRDVRPVLSLSRLLLLPARREGFGLASLEARAWGVPVVVASSPGVHLPADPAEAGILAARPVPELLAQAALRLMREESLWETLSRRGKEQARSLTLGQQLEKIEAVYLQVLEATAAAG